MLKGYENNGGNKGKMTRDKTCSFIMLDLTEMVREQSLKKM